MTAKTKIHYAVLVMLMALTSMQVVAKEKTEKQNKTPKKQELKFRTQAMDQRSFNRIADQKEGPDLTHIAEFYASNLPTINITRQGFHASGDWAKNVIYKDINSSEWINDLLASKAAKKLTADHKILIAKGQAIGLNKMRNTDSPQFRVFAYNASDAKCTVEAIIEVLNEYAETARNELKEKVNTWPKKLADLEKTHEKLKKEREQATESLKNTKKQAHYLSLDEARERIKELNVYLDMERIQIAGTEAGINAMKEYIEKAKKYAESEKAAALEAKIIDQMIELATVKAKYETAEATRAQAEGLISLSNRMEKLKKDMPNISKRIKTAKRDLGTAKAMLLIPAADLFTPKIEPPIVTIYALTEPSQE